MKNTTTSLVALTLALAPTCMAQVPTQPATVRPTIQVGAQSGFTLSPQRPRLMVLMHGITSKPDEAPEENINSAGHARWYWGVDFIQGLMGETNPSQQVNVLKTHTLFVRLQNTTVDDWRQDADFNAIPSELAPVFFPKSFAPDSTTKDQMTPQQVKARIKEVMVRSNDPTTAVMVTFRDGSKHLMPQTADAINQIYDTYQVTFGHLSEANQPQIYLLGHSFGGIVLRTILANPDAADLFGNKLTAEERKRANFIRERTVLGVTSSTPHLGTPIPDQAQDLAAFVRRTGKISEATVSALTDNSALKKYKLSTSTNKKIEDFIQTALNKVSGERDCLNDINRMAEYNKGIIAPNTARRPQGEAVPIYTFGGRNPSGLFFDRERGPAPVNGRMLPYNVFDVLGSGRHGFRAGALYLIESYLRYEGYGKDPKSPWGKATIPEADQISSPMKGTGADKVRKLSDPFNLSGGLVTHIAVDLLDADPFGPGKDGENDSDGFVGFDSAHGLGLTGGAWYRLYSHQNYGASLPWDNDNHDSIDFNPGNGLWLHNELLRGAGPLASNGRVSVWPNQQPTPVGSHSVSVQVVELDDVDNDLDTLSKADFQVTVRIAGNAQTKNAPDDTKTVTTLAPFTASGLPQSVIPIVVSVIERDTPDPDDYVAINPIKGRDNLYLYFDTRTQRIWGDLKGKAGEVLVANGPKGTYNNANIKLKITGQ